LLIQQLKIQCHVVKNTLLQTAFSAISQTGFKLVKFRYFQIIKSYAKKALNFVQF